MHQHRLQTISTQIANSLVLISGCLLALVPVCASAYQTKLGVEIKIDNAPEESWENKPIEAHCNWSLQVTDGTWATGPNPDLKTTMWAIRDPGVYTGGTAASQYRGEFSTKGLAEEAKLAESTNLIPAGTYGSGKGFAGMIHGSRMPDKPGRWVIYCKVGSDNLGVSYYSKSNGAFLNFAGTSRVIFVGAPAPFTPEQLPTPQVVEPLKAPGGEILKVPLDVMSVPLAGRIPLVEITRVGECGSFGTKLTLPFWEWSTKCTKVFEERWHLQLLKRQASGLFAPIKTFSGLVKARDFQAAVSPGSFNADKDGGGVWRLKTWLTQENTPNGTITGEASALDFEVQLLAKTDPVASKSMAEQPLAAASTVKAETAGRPEALAGTIGRTQQPQDAPAIRRDDRRLRQPQQVATRQRGQQAARAGASASLLEIEAESFTAAGGLQVTGGQTSAQAMAGFGGGWSGDKQLFWRDGSTGAVLDLPIDVPVASKYVVEIYLTRAPDYGQLRFEIDGKDSGMTFDGVAPSVAPGGPFQLGTFPLQAGPHKLSLMIAGKNSQSAGYLAGIDKIRLYPAGPIE